MKAGGFLSENVDTRAAAAELVERALQFAAGAAASAVLCWVTPHHVAQLDLLRRTLTAGLGTRCLAGCVSSGVAVGDREVVDGPGMAVMAFWDEEPTRFSARLIRDLHAQPAAAARAAAEGAEEGDLVFTMATTDTFQAPPFLGALERSEATFVGGGAVNPRGADVVFTGEGQSGDAVAVLRIEDCQPLVELTHACRPISPLYRVTACNGQLVSALSGRPAADVLKGLLEPVDPHRGRARGGPLMVGLTDVPGGEQLVRGEYKVRQLMGVTPNRGGLVVGEQMENGMGLAFLRLEVEASRTDLNLMLLEARGQWTDDAPAFGVYANCAGRGPKFQGIPDYEASIISAYLPGVPTAGFFGGFELGPVGGRTAQHFFTAVLSLGC